MELICNPLSVREIRKMRGAIIWRWVQKKRSTSLNLKERFINALLVVIKMGFTFHSNGIKMIQRVRFISSVQTVTTVSESGGRLKVPHKKRGTDERRSKFIPTGKESIYIKAIFKNVIPAKAGIQKLLRSLDSPLRRSDKLIIIRGFHKFGRYLECQNHPIYIIQPAGLPIIAKTYSLRVG
jgi:hypothetical protein